MDARRLVALRKGRNLTQSELAKALKVSQAAVGNWEKGKRDPDIPTLIAIADFFGVSVDYLIMHDDPFLGDLHKHSKDLLSLLSAFRSASFDTQNNIRLILHLQELPPESDSSDSDFGDKANAQTVSAVVKAVGDITEESVLTK